MIDQVNMVATNIRTLYASQRTYAGLNNKVAKQTGVIPAEMYTSETTSLITNAFGGKMFVGPAKQSDTANDSFVILITQIPQPACVSIATTEWGADSGSGLIGMEIMADYAATGTNVLGSFSSSAVAASLNDTNAKGVNNLPYSIVDASTWCSSEGELNTIVWKYL
jgi:hypothetical protein